MAWVSKDGKPKVLHGVNTALEKGKESCFAIPAPLVGSMVHIQMTHWTDALQFRVNQAAIILLSSMRTYLLELLLISLAKLVLGLGGFDVLSSRFVLLFLRFLSHSFIHP